MTARNKVTSGAKGATTAQDSKTKAAPVKTARAMLSILMGIESGLDFPLSEEAENIKNDLFKNIGIDLFNDNGAAIKRLYAAVKDAAVSNSAIRMTDKVMGNEYTIEAVAQRGKKAGEEITYTFKDIFILLNDDMIEVLKTFINEETDRQTKPATRSSSAGGSKRYTLNDLENDDIFLDLAEKTRETLTVMKERGKKMGEGRKKAAESKKATVKPKV